MPGRGIARAVPRVASVAALALGGMAAGYLLAAVVLGLVPVNRGFLPPDDGVEVFVVSNGVHAGFAVPLLSRAADLRGEFPSPAGLGDGSGVFVTLGWGDRRIYTQTKTWSDLTVWNAMSALLGLNGSVLHVDHVARPQPSPLVVPLRLTDESYLRLLAYIRNGAQRDTAGRLLRIDGASLGRQDAFYLANGRYSPLRTCNDWVRDGLSAAGVRTAAWSPFQWPLFRHLRR